MNAIELNGIYKITCKENNKIYIGESHDITTRWSGHINDLINKTHCNYKLQNDFNQYGLSNFNFEIIDILQDNTKSQYMLTMERIYREGCYIDYFDAINKGYNLENTLDEILLNNKYRISPRHDRYCLINLKKGNEVIEPDDKECKEYTTKIIEIKPVIKLPKEKKERKNKKNRNPDNIIIINNTIHNNIDLSSVAGVYSITNITNGKKLISYSENVLTRIKANIKKLDKGTFYQADLQKDWINSDKDNFQYELLDYVPDKNFAYKDFLKLKHVYNNDNISYNHMNNREKIEFELLEKLYTNGYNFSKYHTIKISEDESFTFDIAVKDQEQNIIGFIIFNNKIYCEELPDIATNHKILIDKKIKYCMDNNLKYKIIEVEI